MIKKTFVMQEPIGFHARPATKLAKACKDFCSIIKITSKFKTVDAKSMLAIISLGIENGDEFIISCEGNDQDEAIQKIEEVLKEAKYI